MDFADKIRTLRLERGLTQVEVARAIGITSRAYIAYEKGTSYPRRTGVLEKLASLYDCQSEDLLTQKALFAAQAERKYGTRGAQQAMALTKQLVGMFAGDDLSENDRENVMQAIQEAYWIAKENNRKYTPKKYLKEHKKDDGQV